MRDQPIRVEQARFVDDPVLGVGEEVRIRKRGLRDTRTGTLAAEGMQDTGIGSLAGKEVHSRRVMKEGARADRGTVLFSLSGFSGPPDQTDRREQIDQLPAMRQEMLDCKT